MTDAMPGPIEGSYWVEPGRLLAGPYPAAQTEEGTRARLHALIEVGVSVFVDLTEPHEYAPYIPLALEEAGRVGRRVRYVRLPIVNFGVPERDHMRAILDTIDAALFAGEIVYVHCMGGIGRTGTTVGCWLVRHGQPGEDALQAIERLRGDGVESPETPEQFAFVRGWREGDAT
jgi:hypothetical protein